MLASHQTLWTMKSSPSPLDPSRPLWVMWLKHWEKVLRSNGKLNVSNFILLLVSVLIFSFHTPVNHLIHSLWASLWKQLLCISFQCVTSKDQRSLWFDLISQLFYADAHITTRSPHSQPLCLLGDDCRSRIHQKYMQKSQNLQWNFCFIF